MVRCFLVVDDEPMLRFVENPGLLCGGLPDVENQPMFVDVLFFPGGRIRCNAFGQGEFLINGGAVHAGIWQRPKRVGIFWSRGADSFICHGKRGKASFMGEVFRELYVGSRFFSADSSMCGQSGFYQNVPEKRISV
jgi:hypothetical protein